MNNLTPFYTDPFWAKHTSFPKELRPTEQDLYTENNRGWRQKIMNNLPE